VEYCKLALVLHRGIECNQSKSPKIMYLIVLYIINNMAHILLSFLLIIGYCEHRMSWAKASKQLTRQIMRLVLLLVLPCTPCLAEQSDKDATASSVDTVERAEESVVIKQEIKKPRRSRLKYRNGPVCMCSGGLSEKEIQAAWLKRISQAKD